jgi:hypothetical protein
MEATRGNDDAEALEEPRYESARRLTPREEAAGDAGDAAAPAVFPDAPSGVPALRAPVDGVSPLEEETPRYDGSRRNSRTSKDDAASTVAPAPSVVRPAGAPQPAGAVTPRSAMTTPRALWARLADGGDLRTQLKGKVDKVKHAKLRCAEATGPREKPRAHDAAT